MSELLDSILVVEDEPLIAEDICDTLKDAGYGISGIAHSAKDALLILDNHAPSLALLDINLDGPMNGLELAAIITQTHEIPFIFLTSYTDNETLEKIAALGADSYITKPFNEQELVTNIALAIARHKKNSKHLATLEPQDTTEKQFFVKKGNSLIKIALSDVKYAQAFDNYTYLITDKDKILVPLTLKKISERLNTRNFFRTHRSYMVNLDLVEEICDDHVRLKNLELPLSRGGKAELLKYIQML